MSEVDFATWIIALTMILLEALSDIKKREIKMSYLIIGAVIGVIILFLPNGEIEPLDSLLGILLGISVMVMAFLTGGGIGYGDGLLLCVTGLLLGVRANIILLFAGCFFSSLVSMFLLVIKKADRKTSLPFIPFLIPSLCVVYFFERII